MANTQDVFARRALSTDKIVADIQSLEPSSEIELFALDMSSVGEPTQYFHAGTNGLSANIVWQGRTYYPLPIEAEGFDVVSDGTLPRPKLRVALDPNSDVMTDLIAQYDDLVGMIVVRKRTLLKYLDAINFPGGVNPTADPNQHYPDDIWYIDWKTVEKPRQFVEWELASAFDLMGVMLPGRQVIQGSCPWKYKGPECNYAGTRYADAMDNVTTNPALDVCGKRLESCEYRFGAGNVLPFGGFPGALRYD